MSTVPINPTSIKKYLDKCIRYWRNKSKNSKIKVEKIIAESNIDAFQSVRISLLGELLPKEGKMNDKMLRELSRGELLVFASEVKSTGDQEFLDRITDEFKRRNEKERRKNEFKTQKINH